MFLKRKAKKQPSSDLRRAVVGICSQVDHLVAIIQDSAASASDRITASEIVRSFVDFQSLSSISEIWYATGNLLSLENQVEIRRAGWRLCLSCIKQDELNNSAFTAYYVSIVRNSNVEDFDLVLECLDALTSGGRRVTGSHAPKQLPQVLLEWIQMLAIRSQEIRKTSRETQDVAVQWGGSTEQSFHKLLMYTINLLKFSTSVWEPLETEKLLLVVVCTVRSTSQIMDCQLCCLIVENVMAFGLMPATMLQPVLEILCGIITTIPSLQELCTRLVRSLSNSHLSNSTFVRLCRICDSPNQEVTRGMRIAAAQQLKDLLVFRSQSSNALVEGSVLNDSFLNALESSENSGDHASKTEEPLHKESSPTVKGNAEDSESSINASSGSQHWQIQSRNDSLIRSESTIDPTLPVIEVLECYYRTIVDESTNLKITVSILECFCDLVVKFGLLKRVHTGTWMWSDSVFGAPAEISPESWPDVITPTVVIQKFDEIFHKTPSSEIKDKFQEHMKSLGQYLVSILLDKDLNTSIKDQIRLIVRISHFLDTESCDLLIGSIESLQVCTPGIPNWFKFLREVMQYIYIRRMDRCRASVLRIIQHVYALDAQQEGWIDNDDLAWITTTTFEALSTADESTLNELIQIYENRVFFSDAQVFANATDQLVNVACSGLVRAIEALTTALGRAFKLHTRQTLVVLDALQRVCMGSLKQPEVFVRSWVVFCSLRSDRWDRLLLIENGAAEESYGADLISFVQTLPKELKSQVSEPSLVLKVKVEADQDNRLDTAQLLKIIIKVLQADCDGRCLMMLLVTLASQLTHYRLMCNTNLPKSLELLKTLRDVIMQLIAQGGAQMPSTITSSQKNACLNALVHCLNVLLPLNMLFGKAEHDKVILILVDALGKRQIQTSWAVHCLLVECYENYGSVQRYLPQILSRLQLKITSRDSSVYILDFLLSISLEARLTKNFTLQDYKRVFGMCFMFIQNANDLLLTRDKQSIIAQWLLQLAYSAICNLFLSMKLENRRFLVPYLVRNLVLADNNPSAVDSAGLVTYDMINRFTYSDVPLLIHMNTVPENLKDWDVRRWLSGVTVIEIRCNRRTGEAVRIVRRPAGIFTTFMQPGFVEGTPINLSELESEEGDIYSSNFYLLCDQLGLAGFHIPIGEEDANNKENVKSKDTPVKSTPTTTTNENPSSSTQESNSQRNSEITSSGADSGLQPQSKDDSNGSPSPNMKLTSLPDDAATNRAILSLDRVPIVNFHKVGIIYVAPGQRDELEILANSGGSAAYRRFLDKLGVLIRLKHNRMYYVGGLDTEQDLDGEYAIAWSSKISQVIFHTATMMPQSHGDTQFAGKKRHIGNNFVNVYFDESGEDFVFDVVKSQFNFINVVITPTYHQGSVQYWKVRALRKPGMQNSLSAYDVKVVSETNLAPFVRNLTLEASQYAAIHNLGSEYMDNWVYRLQLINQLRDRIDQHQQSDQNESDSSSDDDYLEEKLDEPAAYKDMEILSLMDFTTFTK